jgi:hypothetical protein
MEKGIKDWCERRLGKVVSLYLYSEGTVKGVIWDVDDFKVTLVNILEEEIIVVLSDIKGMRVHQVDEST